MKDQWQVNLSQEHWQMPTALMERYLDRVQFEPGRHPIWSSNINGGGWVGLPDEALTKIVRAKSTKTYRATNLLWLYVSYWSAFRTSLASSNSDLKSKREFKHYWCSFPIGRAGFSLVATAKFRDKIIGAELYIQRSDAKQAFAMLHGQKQEIESEFGEPLVWMRWKVGRPREWASIGRMWIQPMKGPARSSSSGCVQGWNACGLCLGLGSRSCNKCRTAKMMTRALNKGEARILSQLRRFDTPSVDAQAAHDVAMN